MSAVNVPRVAGAIAPVPIAMIRECCRACQAKWCRTAEASRDCPFCGYVDRSHLTHARNGRVHRLTRRLARRRRP